MQVHYVISSMLLSLSLSHTHTHTQLLLQAEDDSDVRAMHLAKEEQAAEMAEFDENFSAQTATSNKEVSNLELHVVTPASQYM